jgi:hypothetical protein
MNSEGMDSKLMFRFLDLEIKGYLDAETLEKALK